MDISINGGSLNDIITQRYINKDCLEWKGFLPQTPSMRFPNGNLKPRFPFQSIHFVYWLNLLFLLHVFLTIEAIYVLLYCSLSDNASKRTKCRFLSRAEGRGEMLRGRRFKICQRFIYSIFIITYFSSSAAKFINLSTFAPGSRKTKLGYLWWLFQRSRDPYGSGFRRLKLLREKN